ncbi:MAG TPA: CHAT domain-containing protein [Thermoanaerobaculia bacterium]|nr:CHAT domain-containing protein [Thermoanaerobaculia bacterium]
MIKRGRTELGWWVAHTLGRGALLAAAAAWVVCTPRLAALAVEVANCEEWRRDGPVCVPGEKAGQRSLRLWPHPSHATRRLELFFGSRRISANAPADRLLTVVIPRGTPWIELRALAPKALAVWSLRLAEPCPSRWLAAAERWIGSDGVRSPRARRLLAENLPRAAAADRGAALDLLALPLNGVAKGELLRPAARAHHDAGLLLGEIRDVTQIVHQEIEDHHFLAARRLLAELPLPEHADAEATLASAYYGGLLARCFGDLRSALDQLRSAAELAARLKFSERWRSAIEQEQALALQDMGRLPEAIALLEDWARRTPASANCNQVNVLVNYGWALLMARQAGGGSAPAADLFALLERAKKALDDHKCEPPNRRLNARINLALAFLQSGDVRQARIQLAEASRWDAEAKPDQRLWRLEIEGRLALLAERPLEALGHYTRLQELAASALSPYGLWLAAYGRARALAGLGRVEEALLAYRAASRLVDSQSLAIPVFDGRESFAVLREEGTRSYLDLLVRSGRVEEALAVARRARSRVLRQLERADRLAHLAPASRERWDLQLAEYWRRRDELDGKAANDWRLAADKLDRARKERAELFGKVRAALDSAFTLLGSGGDGELAPPGQGEVILAYYRLRAGDWVGFAADARRVRCASFQLPEGGNLPAPGELAQRLLEPFHEAIEQARRVRVLPYGVLQEVDFHALPFAGDLLLAARPVVYGLDLQTLAGAPPGGPQRAALVVADPRGDLPYARREGEAVAAALGPRGAGWRVDLLAQGAADSAAVARSLERVDLLHYAGHARVSGFAGWESELPLGQGTRLTVGDLLALRRAPAWVVLSGCETGRTAAGVPVETLGLAHAFLLAGARSVVAAPRPVDDRAARELFAELYRGWSAEPDLAGELRRAQLALRRRDAAGDWRSFRVYEP